MRIYFITLIYFFTLLFLLTKCIKNKNRNKISNISCTYNLSRIRNRPVLTTGTKRRKLRNNFFFLNNYRKMISLCNKIDIKKRFLLPKLQGKYNLYCTTKNVERTRIKDLFKMDIKEAQHKNFKICGWIKSVRTVGKSYFVFVDINDGSYYKNLQVIIDDKIPDYEYILKTSTDDAIECFGELKGSIGKKQNVELCVYDISKNHYIKLFKQMNQDTVEEKEKINDSGNEKDNHNFNSNGHVNNYNDSNNNNNNNNNNYNNNNHVNNYHDSNNINDNIIFTKNSSGHINEDNKTKGAKHNKEDYYVISKKYHTKQYLRNYPHLRARTKLYSSLFRLKSDIIFETFNFLKKKKNYTYINTPILTSNDCEGAGKLFYATTLFDQQIKNEQREDHMKKGITNEIAGNIKEKCYYQNEHLEYISRHKSISKMEGFDEMLLKNVSSNDCISPNNTESYNTRFENDFFKKACYLNVSSQLSLECLCCSIGDVFTLNPSFRAENSNTFRHLSEFLMLEVELAFSNLKDIIDISEEYIKEMITYALYKSEDVNYLNEYHDKDLKNKLENILNKKFVLITYDEAINILKKENVFYDFQWGKDFSFEEQKYLATNYFKAPVVIINYPTHIKPFYMKLNEDEKTVSCMDIIFPDVGEVVGGSEREINLKNLKKQMENKKLNMKLYDPYIQLRKHGNIPHAGFGIGMDRLIMFLSSINNIRDVVTFPRYPGSLFM
ncbi:asparagine-tRNA ligase [Plasmodium falciparum Tanzania (2000708)]|uniref:asparagine--tRNA ligase n=1 Tax=Plasmodium falciparum Tanzania (2000708) TaxID=1036725 RepID=A0A024WBN4_PLAFA|nr:asparagine-tRNA ligase [Plasmodium falciparum Tanzania (2000708)]